MADAYFRPAAFRSLPSRPTHALARGAWVTVRSGEKRSETAAKPPRERRETAAKPPRNPALRPPTGESGVVEAM